MRVPGLDERIAENAKALLVGDHRAAEAFVLEAGLENWRSAVGQLAAGRLEDFELLACAKIGQQFIAKTRFHSATGSSTLLVRWKTIDGKWVIADAENITGKRSPWSDIPHYDMEGRGTSNA
jgi:hypothetical protein